VVIAKGAQLGFTAAAENVVIYYMDASPSEILFISATEGLLRKWVTKRLEPAIDSCGFRSRIAAQGQLKQRRRTGDLVFSKEYPGGTLDMASAQAAAMLRADSKRILVRDEIDGAPTELKSGEGNWLDVSYVRTNAWGSRRKVLDFSTPTTFDESAIWPEYELGDCRKFAVPCPHCGGYQFLVWDGGKDGPGIKWKMEGSRVAEVWYRCEHCSGAIKNHHKEEMLKLGEWRPTAISESETLRSYYLSSIYSPVGMLSWEELVAAFLRSERSAAGMRSFVNLYLGEPFREMGQRPPIDKVVELRSGYKSGTIPSDDILYLTMAVDVQTGSVRNPEGNPERLEGEICAHGAGYRTWSINYFRVLGGVRDPYAGAWEKLTEMAHAGEFRFERRDGRIFEPVVTLLDSGDGTNLDTVYEFASGWRNTYASAGVALLKKKQDKIEDVPLDEMGTSNFDRYRVTRQKNDSPVILISTNYYKHHVYNSLKIHYKPGAEQQAPGFCAFPQDYSSKYFEMLIAEERRSDGSFYCPSGRRNEALDVRVYNLAARDFYMDSKIAELRDYYKSKGCTRKQLEEIRSPAVLKLLTEATRPKPLKQ
jgi:phage terminase large subunit GpA-like protein